MTAVRSFLRIQPKPGKREHLIRFYADNRIIEIAVERGLSDGGELLIPADPDAPLVVTCTWPSREHYAEWVSSRPAAAGDLADLVELPDSGLPAGDLFDIEAVIHP